MRRVSYSPPAGEMAGAKTFVTDRSSLGLPPDPIDTTAPAGSAVSPRGPSNEDAVVADEVQPSFAFNTPSDSGISDRPRTMGIPGEQYGHPYKEDLNTVTRRSLVAAYVLFDWLYETREAGLKTPFPRQRQRIQRGPSKLRSKRFYMRNRARHLSEARRRYKKMRNNPAFKRDRTLRRKYPHRFTRRRGSVLTAPEIAFYLEGRDTIGFVHKLSPMTGMVTFATDAGHFESRYVMQFIRDVVFLSEEDIEEMFQLIDTEVGIEAYDELPGELDTEALATIGQEHLFVEGDPSPPTEDLIYGDKKACDCDDEKEAGDTFLYEREDTVFTPTVEQRRPPAYDPPAHGENQPPATSRVIPQTIKSAATIGEILTGTESVVHDRAKQRRVSLRRADPKRGIWTFSVTGSKGKTYTVRVKGLREGNAKDMRNMQVQVSCTCPFYQWQGPEHWATADGYMHGKPMGTATFPKIMDPSRQHLTCKHGVLALRLALNYKTASTAPSVSRVAERFLKPRR